MTTDSLDITTAARLLASADSGLGLPGAAPVPIQGQADALLAREAEAVTRDLSAMLVAMIELVRQGTVLEIEALGVRAWLQHAEAAAPSRASIGGDDDGTLAQARALLADCAVERAGRWRDLEGLTAQARQQLDRLAEVTEQANAADPLGRQPGPASDARL